jgi:2-dehydro-3-deoxygluconokinase
MAGRGERGPERKSLESLCWRARAGRGAYTPRMPSAARVVLSDSRGCAFDVICAGEALVSLAPDGASVLDPSLRFFLGGGAVSAALSLARQGLRVGLSTVLSDDAHGRGLKERIAGEGVDVGGVELAQPSSGIMFVRGGARQRVVVHDVERPIAIPEGWTSQVLLLSGMSPVVSHGAALCKAARAGRRSGAVVVVDVNARWDLWKGRDARAILMILREADVVWSSAADLFGLNMDAATMRSALRKNAVLALSDGAGSAIATGPFGEVVRRPAGALDGGDAFATAICAELARAGHAGETSGELWTRALARGHEAVTALGARISGR